MILSTPNVLRVVSPDMVLTEKIPPNNVRLVPLIHYMYIVLRNTSSACSDTGFHMRMSYYGPSIWDGLTRVVRVHTSGGQVVLLMFYRRSWRAKGDRRRICSDGGKRRVTDDCITYTFRELVRQRPKAIK